MGERFKVLIVDDEPDIVEIVTDKIYDKFGEGTLSISGFSKAARAIQSISMTPFDLIITDFCMDAGMCALNIIKHAKQCSHPRPPIIIYSASDETMIRKSVDLIKYPNEVKIVAKNGAGRNELLECIAKVCPSSLVESF